jgi:NAD(P)-dependent dehydrogenase (short-subunit alcohol dehydrogenase family)
MDSLRGRTIVITGASSGIGRATALAFARYGGRLALGAQRRNVLEEVAEQCRQVGGEAIAVQTDVIDLESVRALARVADETFGGIDVWVNNAGTGVLGPYAAVPFALHRRTIEVNLLGAMHGAYAALPVFLRQGWGTLINNISIGGWCPTPYTGAYTTSKFALRGFAASLRQELLGWPDIHVCGVFPTIVDTPGLEHAANLSGRRINPGPFLYAPEDVAHTIVGLAIHPRDEVAVGWPARVAQVAYTLAPRPTEWVVGSAMSAVLRHADSAPPYEGALLNPVPQGTATAGGWRERNHVPSARTLTRLGLACIGAAFFFASVSYARR